MSDFTPLRSVLYMPSSNERALEKAKTIACDGLILDLEDAVAPDAKPAAREAAAAAAASGEYGRRTLTIRVNGIGTEWHDDDIVAAAQAGPARVVVPKVNSADEVRSLVAAAGEGRRARTTPGCGRWSRRRRRSSTSREIAAASDRLAVLVMGTNDLVKELYAEHVPGRAPLLTALSLVAAGRPGRRHRDPRRRLQRREGHRRLPGRVPAGPRDGLRRQDADPPRPGRGRQRGVRAVASRPSRTPAASSGLGGRPGLRRRHLQRPDGREPARRVGAADPRDRTRRSARCG